MLQQFKLKQKQEEFGRAELAKFFTSVQRFGKCT